jgi:hypothetical protein
LSAAAARVIPIVSVSDSDDASSDSDAAPRDERAAQLEQPDHERFDYHYSDSALNEGSSEANFPATSNTSETSGFGMDDDDDESIDLTQLYARNQSDMHTAWCLPDEPGSEDEDDDVQGAELDDDDDDDDDDEIDWDSYARPFHASTGDDDGLSAWDWLGASYDAEFADIGMLLLGIHCIY